MKVKTPKEDPSIKAARDREERRADAAFIENTSSLLDEETRKRIRRFGTRGGAVRVSGGGGGGGRGGGGAGGSGGGSYDPGGSGRPGLDGRTSGFSFGGGDQAQI